MLRFLALALALTLTACNSSDTAGRPDSALVRLSGAEARSLDPQTVADVASLQITTDIFEGLMRTDAKGTPEPGLAARWDVSADGRTWTFHLRPDLRFSDGAPIDATTVVASFNRLRDPRTASPNAILVEAFDTLTARDALTVELRLRQPFPALLELLSHPALVIVPIHRIRAAGAQWTQDRPLVSSGAYRLEDWKLGQGMRLVRNPHYHEAAAVRIAAVHWQTVEDSQTALRQLRAGAADIISSIPAAQLPRLRKTMPESLFIAPYRAVYYWTFNTRRPPFDDARVRRALSMTIERPLITDRLMADGSLPAWRFVPPDLGAAPVQPAWADWPRTRRLAEARRLLAAAGYGPGRPLVAEIRFNSSTDHRRIAIAIAQFWKPLGVELRLFNSEATVHFAAMQDGDFTIARAGWVGDISAAENFLIIHRSTDKALNYSGYTNLRYDALVNAALDEADARRRHRLLAEAERLLLDDAPVIPVYFHVSKNLVAPRVKGWHDNVADMHPARTLRLD